MVILFFFVGFLTCINQQFQGPIKKVFLDDPSLESIKFTLGTIIIFSWFLAYPLTGNVGSNWVSKFGYKGTMIRIASQWLILSLSSVLTWPVRA